MKKIYILLILYMFIAAGCTQQGSATVKPLDEGIEQAKPAAVETAKTEITPQPTAQGEAKETAPGVPAEGKEPGTDNTEVIVKSENIVSDKEKEQLLNELDTMLDGVIDNINETEDIENIDLDEE